MVGPGPPINQILWIFFCRRGTPFCRKRPVYTHPTSLYENKIICQCQAPPFCRRFGIPFCRWVRGVDKYIHKCKYIWTQKNINPPCGFCGGDDRKVFKASKILKPAPVQKKTRWPLLRSSLSDYFCWTILYETRLPDAQDAKIWDMQGLLERF